MRGLLKTFIHIKCCSERRREERSWVLLYALITARTVQFPVGCRRIMIGYLRHLSFRTSAGVFSQIKLCFGIVFYQIPWWDISKRPETIHLKPFSKNVQANLQFCSKCLSKYLKDTKKASSGPRIQIDFERNGKRCSSSDMFPDNGQLGMLEAYDFDSFDCISPFLGRIVDVFCEQKAMRQSLQPLLNMLNLHNLHSGEEWDVLRQKKIYFNWSSKLSDLRQLPKTPLKIVKRQKWERKSGICLTMFCRTFAKWET